MVYFFTTSERGIIATATENLLTKEDIEKLCWLYSGATLVDGQSVEGYFVGPRREMITPWSTNAVEITQNMGIEGVQRIEEYFAVADENDIACKSSALNATEEGFRCTAGFNADIKAVTVCEFGSKFLE